MDHIFRHSYRLVLLVLLPLLLTSCNEPDSELAQVIEKGKLVVITRNAATSYYEGPHGYTGLEYDLARGFAKALGVKLDMVVASNVGDVMQQLSDGKGDFAAAGLTITLPRKKWVRFTPPYQEITQQLVYRSGKKRPHDLGSLDGTLEITADSSHEEQLHKLHSQYRNLSWTENHEVESEDLLTLVWDKMLDYTVADSNEVATYRRFYPELRVAFDISKPQQLAWAFPKQGDDSLYQAASEYFKQIKKNGYLARLIERYYGHLDDFDYVGTRTYMRHMRQRLPSYLPLFKYAAKEFGIDWRLLAATAYQESHWNPDAISPTGVKGMMMLTKVTASEIGVKERTDPVQSIRGGALYLKQMLAKIPQRIPEPDRSWLALAAYNIGYGHLEDARVITQKLGGDPDSWKDVKKSLPLLRMRKWHSLTKHGYARGNEAVRYVENIRSYYDILAWFTDQERHDDTLIPSRPLRIASPAL